MKIQSVEAIAIDIPLTKNFGGSTSDAPGFGIQLDRKMIERYRVA